MDIRYNAYICALCTYLHIYMYADELIWSYCLNQFFVGSVFRCPQGRYSRLGPRSAVLIGALGAESTCAIVHDVRCVPLPITCVCTLVLVDLVVLSDLSGPQPAQPKSQRVPKGGDPMVRVHFNELLLMF